MVMFGRCGPVVTLLAALATSACLPHFHHLEHVKDVQRVLVGEATRDEVRRELGEPSMVDTPRMYVYEWEKAKTLAIGYGDMLAVGHTGTRALFVFDEAGCLVRAEIKGTGQGKDEDTQEAGGKLPQAAAVSPTSEPCADKHARQVWLLGPEPRMVVAVRRAIRVCDAAGSALIASLPGTFNGAEFTPDGRLAVTFEKGNALTLRDGSTLEPIRELEPPSYAGLSLLSWGLAISLSADGSRVASQVGNHGVSVYDTTTGAAILRLAGRWSPRLSPDGSLLVSKARAGFMLTDVSTGRDLVSRPLPKYPYGMSPNPGLARLLEVRLGATDFSPDGRRIAVASCAHAEVWDLAAILSSGWQAGPDEAFLLPFTRAFGVCSATVRFSSDGASLAVANEGTVTLFDLIEHKIRAAFALPYLNTHVAISPDLARMAFLGPDGVLTWEVGKVSRPGSEGGSATRGRAFRTLWRVSAREVVSAKPPSPGRTVQHDR